MAQYDNRSNTIHPSYPHYGEKGFDHHLSHKKPDFLNIKHHNVNEHLRQPVNQHRHTGTHGHKDY